MTIAVKGSDIVVLFVADLARSREFYGTVLGMQLTQEDDTSSVYATDAGSVLLLGRAGAAELLGDAVALEAPRGVSSIHVASVPDVDAAYATLASRGVTFLRAPEDRWWGLRTAHFADPDGHVWEINHSLPEA